MRRTTCKAAFDKTRLPRSFGSSGNNMMFCGVLSISGRPLDLQKEPNERDRIYSSVWE